MVRRLDHHFMRPDAIHLVKHAVSLAVEVAFNPQRRKFVRDHAQVPSRSVAAILTRAVSQNLRRRLILIARTKRTEARTLDHGAFTEEVAWAPRAVSRDDDPAPGYGVFSKFRHGIYVKPF